MSSEVKTITDYNGNIYIGGSFNTVGGVNCKKVAKWNGSVWSPLGNGLSSSVYTLLPYNGDLYAGGTFDDPTSTISGYDNIAKWTNIAVNIEMTNNTNDESVSIYPNPVNDLLTLEWNEIDQEDIQIKFFNTVGIMVLDIPIQKYQQKTTINLSNLSPGVYFISIIKNKNIKMYQIIKE